uniref:Uncharacterized protein n=1 Tax=Musca domestica TaxID=7370 RepID=A0A1I8MRV7_MUSDO
MTNNIVFIYILEYLGGINSFLTERTFDIKVVEVYSSRPDLISFADWKVERISRGVFGLSGKYTVNTTILEGDSNEIEVLIYRSYNGVRDFRPLPLNMERKHIYDYMNVFYKMYVMNSIRTCSTMPVFEGRFKPPLEKKTYVLEKCQVKVDDYPLLLEGFYKFAVIGYGEADWSMNFTGQMDG